ncbi:MAG: DNA methyltransferase [Nitrospira sp.]|nr:DNA methyltransferase [Nitrospira sp.]
MGQRTTSFVQADAARLPFADNAFDLVFGSPPYCDARTYGIGAQRGCEEWVAWMLAVSVEAQRVCRGAVVWIVGSVTRKRNYWPAPEGLMWEWWKRGGECQLYRPCFWHRVGVPGSGHDDWFRSDVEYAICMKRPGPLPWSDNTARGKPPKWAPGGEMSYRLSSGQRVDQWGGNRKSDATHYRKANGERQAASRPSHIIRAMREPDGTRRDQAYKSPVLANPGNLIVGITVGGGHLGDRLAHRNEAPFPEKLAEWFISSLCPPGGNVLDPFSGSGTTVAAAVRLGRHGVGVDVRDSQTRLGQKRLMNVTPGFVFDQAAR